MMSHSSTFPYCSKRERISCSVASRGRFPMNSFTISDTAWAKRNKISNKRSQACISLKKKKTNTAICFLSGKYFQFSLTSHTHTSTQLSKGIGNKKARYRTNRYKKASVIKIFGSQIRFDKTWIILNGNGNESESINVAERIVDFLTTIKTIRGTSLVVQWFGLHAWTAESSGSIPGRELRSARRAVEPPKYFFKRKQRSNWIDCLKLCTVSSSRNRRISHHFRKGGPFKSRF